jgi:hypothetical protein
MPLGLLPDTSDGGCSGDLGRFYWFLPGLASASNDFFYFHTNINTPGAEADPLPPNAGAGRQWPSNDIEKSSEFREVIHASA